MCKKYNFGIKINIFIPVFIILLSWINNTAFAQLNGTYTINNTLPTSGTNYHSFTDAVTALNGGISGPVLFNVTAGQTFSELPPVITATGTAVHTIKFQRSGAGNNPVISAAGTAGTMDGIIILAGSSYVTFDGIDVKDAGSAVEWGYALLKRNNSAPFNGCQYVTIKNCNITLNNSNNLSTGIYSNVHTSSSLTQLTITSSSDALNNCTFSNNVIQNSYFGIRITGFLSGPSAPLTLYDQNNLISGNSISNFGSSSTGTDTVTAVFVKNQNNCSIRYNSITGGLATSSLMGIMAFGTTSSVSGNFASIDISGNIIDGLACSSSNFPPFVSIFNGIGSKGINNTVSIKNNIVRNCNYTISAVGTMTGIWTLASAFQVIISGNTINNNSTTTGGIFNCIQSDNAYALTIDSNIISNNSKTGTNVLRGIYTSNSNGTEEIYANIVENLTSAQGPISGINNSSFTISSDVYGNTVDSLFITGGSNGSLYGILENGNNPGAVRTMHDNIVFGIHVNIDGSNGVYGIGCVLNVNSLKVYNNKVYDISEYGTGAGQVTGIYAIGPYSLYVYNNFVSDINAPKSNQGATTFPVNGIIAYPYYNTSSYAGIFYNTIYLNSSSTGSTYSTAAMSVASTYGLCDIKNNNLINTSAPGLGYTAAFRRYISTSFILSSLKSNGNNFYAGTPGSNNLVYYDDGASPTSTLASYKNLVSPNDANSVSVLPPFVNISSKPYDLRIQNGLVTDLYKAGISVNSPISVTNDYFGNIRNSSFPDIGAHEFTGISNDLIFPVISFTPISNTTSTSSVSLTAIITDQSGVPVSGSGLPSLYWKRNSGSWSRVTGNTLGNGQYSFSFGSGVTVNDSVFYYIAAQDGAGTPNVGTYPLGGASGFSPNPPSASTPPSSPMMYKILGGYSGVYHIGSSGNYTTITAAATAFNNNFLSGPVTYIINKDYVSSEPSYPVIFYNNPGSSSANTLTIKPESNGVSVSGPLTSQSSSSYNKALLAFWGTRYVTLDGSYNGTNSKDLTLIGDSVTCVVSIGSLGTGQGATNITIKNLNIIGGNNNQYGITGIALDDTGLGFLRYLYAGRNNNNITIQNNSISNCRDGITAVADQEGLDYNLVISNNVIGDPNSSNSITRRGIFLQGASAPVISGNEIYNMVQNYPTLQYPNKDIIGIDINQDINGAVVSSNKIHNIQANYSTTAQGAIGIFVYGGQYLTTNNCRIYNNFISGLSSSDLASSSSLNNNPVGIRIYSGSGHQVYFNSVFLSGNQLTYTGTGKSTTAAAFGTDGINVYNLDLRNNILIDSLKSQNANSKMYSVYIAPGSTISNIDYNDYFVPSAAGYNIGFFGSDFNSLTGATGWQGITHQDLHSSNIAVNFASLQDLHLSGTSIADIRLKGIPINGITADIDGDMRSLYTPHMGADETPIVTLNLTAIIEGFYNGTSMVSDTVTAELHNTSSPYTLIDYVKMVLNSSGVGSGTFHWGINGTLYYLAFKHRNALETWSASGNSFSSSSLNYNFTTASSQAYGSNMIQKGSKWCIYSGDVNHDGIVDSGDLAAVDNDNSNYISGYTDTDVNGDGIVDSGDLAVVDNNNAAYVSIIVPTGASKEVRLNRLQKLNKYETR